VVDDEEVVEEWDVIEDEIEELILEVLELLLRLVEVAEVEEVVVEVLELMEYLLLDTQHLRDIIYLVDVNMNVIDIVYTASHLAEL